MKSTRTQIAFWRRPCCGRRRPGLTSRAARACVTIPHSRPTARADAGRLYVADRLGSEACGVVAREERHRIVTLSRECTSEREDEQTMAEEKVRRGLLLKTALEILRDAGTKIPPSQVLEELQPQGGLTPYELSPRQ